MSLQKCFVAPSKPVKSLTPLLFCAPPIFSLAYINGVTIQRRTFTTTFFSSFYSCLRFSPFAVYFFYQWISTTFSITMLQLQLLQLLLPLCMCSLTSPIANMCVHGMTAANAFHDALIFHDIAVFTLVNALIIVNGKAVASNLSNDQL